MFSSVSGFVKGFVWEELAYLHSVLCVTTFMFTCDLRAGTIF